MTSPVLEIQNVSRSFGPVQVLHDIDFALHAGQVHALIGENGAGKSTTMKILAGYLQPSAGQVVLDGSPVQFASSQAAENAGVIMIHQEFNLAQQLSVAENIFLGREIKRGLLLDHAAMHDQSKALLERLNCPIDPRAKISDISVPNRQMVEIAKALGRNARVLIMDEPTAVLTSRETDILLEQINRLREQGTAILYTSHKLDEIAHIADYVTVLRDGHQVFADNAAGLSEDQMAETMVGRELSNLFPPKQTPQDETVLRVDNLTVEGWVENVSFTLNKGEVLGIAGLVGSGRTEMMEGVVGLRHALGQVTINAAKLKSNSVLAARHAGMVYLTEDRKEKGLLLNKNLRENLTLLALDKLSGLFIDKQGEERALDTAIDEFDIRAGDREMNAGNLSGGNQQKLLLAKTMLAEPDIVIIDEPTRGIDIGTKQQIYEFINQLAASGKSVIVISSEMSEVIGLSNRVIVMASGQVAGELTGDDINESTIVRLAMGMTQNKATAA
ncbi:UNVERIFIED_CONTAM: hypothetical protein GTU68_062437 [Idotea baltica]|nr:hypothetical protein [Idotea baltica]